MPRQPSPCRLFVYLARDAPLGVVLRRGPNAWARLSLWQVDTDVFEHGQWFAGHVFERRADVSPDGSLFVYFTQQMSRRAAQDLGTDAWIAVSRPPWFTALALWTIGTTYCAGGYFPDERSLLVWGIASPPDRGVLPAWLRLAKEAPYVDGTPEWPDRAIYFNRLLRDGWTPIGDIRARLPWWEHRSPGGHHALVMMPRTDADFRAYGGPHVVEYGVRDDLSGVVHDLGRATWADWDHRGRLIVAQDGRLLQWQLPGELREIADFNEQTPAPVPSPKLAHDWPPRGARKNA